MNAIMTTPSTIGATYVEPSADQVLEPGLKIGDLFNRNMTQPYVLQRLSERHGGFRRSTTARSSTSVTAES